jgi:hypothetical protein
MKCYRNSDTVFFSPIHRTKRALEKESDPELAFHSTRSKRVRGRPPRVLPPIYEPHALCWRRGPGRVRRQLVLPSPPAWVPFEKFVCNYQTKVIECPADTYCMWISWRWCPSLTYSLGVFSFSLKKFTLLHRMFNTWSIKHRQKKN